MKRNGIVTLVLAAAVFWVTNASAVGVGVGVVVPTGDFGDHYDVGFGAHAILDYPVTPLASIYADLGYQTFAGKKAGVPPVEAPDLDVINVSAGGRAGFGSFYLGAEAGYYFVSEGGDDEFGATPVLGMNMGPLDLSARYKFTDELKWFEVRGSLTF